jgi:UDP-N-acetyl-D-mannosaminuronate dehydrogenase
MISAMFNTISRKRIALFGLAFGRHQRTRESALAVCRALLEEHAEVVLSDPKHWIMSVMTWVKTPIKSPMSLILTKHLNEPTP